MQRVGNDTDVLLSTFACSLFIKAFLAAKNSSGIVARHLPTLSRHYANAISFKFTLMLSQLYDYYPGEVHKCFDKTMVDLATLLNASMDSDRTSMVVMIGE